MIKKCITLEEKLKVEEYIGKEYNKCLYLYMDLKKYSLNFPSVNTWIQYDKKENIEAVFLKYYEGLHIYSKEIAFNKEELSDFILKLKPNIICAEKNVIDIIKPVFSNNGYKYENGWVRKLDNLLTSNIENVENAEYEDFLSIAKLVYSDEDIGSSYDFEKLKDQMYERNKQGFVRNYIIKDNEKVIAHAGTGAEYEQIAIINYVVTDKKYRRNGLATKICTKLCKDLKEDDKEVFLINYSSESTNLYTKLGFDISCEWAKLYVDLKEKR